MVELQQLIFILRLAQADDISMSSLVRILLPNALQLLIDLVVECSLVREIQTRDELPVLEVDEIAARQLAI